MSEETQSSIDAVIKAVEEQVSNSCVGPARAYFEFPTNDGKGVIRGVYRTLYLQAPTVLEALKGLQHCIEDQITRASSLSMTTALFWRMPEKIDVEAGPGGEGIRVRTRVVVLPDGNDT